MKAELWLNRADHELSMAKELLGAGSLLWAASYAHRSLEYALEGLIILKTGERPERGSRLSDLQALTQSYLPDSLKPAVDNLTALTPVAWQSDVRKEDIRFLTEAHTRKVIDGAVEVLSWIGEEWNKSIGTETSASP